MSAVRKTDLSAHSTDNVQVAIHDAMERIKSCAPSSTLIASIPQDEWDAWDHSHVNPIVVDADGLNTRDEDSEIVAA